MSAPSAPREIGVLCSYAPRELIEAAGFRVRFLSGLEHASPGDGLSVNLCAYVRRCASYFDNGGAPSMAGVVLTDSCYPMLRLWDSLQETKKMPFTRLIRVPRGKSPEAVEFFRLELEGLSAALADLNGSPLEEEKLRRAVGSSNRVRSLQCRLKNRMMTGPRPGLASEFMSLLCEAESESGHVGDRLEALLRKADRGGGKARARRPRLLVAAAFFIGPDLLSLLEDRGAVVSTVDSCFAGRFGLGPIETDGGVLLANLAEAYVSQPPCPRMTDSAQHLRRLGELAALGFFDGALLLSPKNCAHHSYHVPLWRETMRAGGVPAMALEVEDGDCSRPGLITRLEAFLETLKGRAR